MEGVDQAVRYTPFEFNGWKERHWTLPFQGERFSLVFFTPAEAGPKQTAEESRHALEQEAAGIAALHSISHRAGSNDANVLVEIFREEVYRGPGV